MKISIAHIHGSRAPGIRGAEEFRWDEWSAIWTQYADLNRAPVAWNKVRDHTNHKDVYLAGGILAIQIPPRVNRWLPEPPRGMQEATHMIILVRNDEIICTKRAEPM